MVLRPVLVALLAAGAATAGVPEQFTVRGKRAAAHPQLKDAALAPIHFSKIRATRYDRDRGFVPIPWPAFSPLPWDTAPPAGTEFKVLEARDTPGEYGTIAFAFLIVRPGVYSIVLSDLAGPGGTISRAELDLRFVRWIEASGGGRSGPVPLLLESFDALTLMGGRVQPFWLTYHVPPGTMPGVYRGTGRVVVNTQFRWGFRIELTVLPFTLPPAGAWFYMYDEAVEDPAARATRWADQRLHGMTMADLHPPVTRDGDLEHGKARRLLDAYRAAGFTRPRFLASLYNRITSEWVNEPDKAIGMWGPWFRYYPFSAKLDRRLADAARFLRDEARERGLEAMLEVGDEAGSHPWTIEATKHYLDLVAREAPGPGLVRELTVGGGWAGGEPEEDHWRGRLDVWTTNRWLPDKLDRVRRENPAATIQVYNMAGAGSGPGGLLAPRMLFGFFAWKAGAAGAAQWVYQHSSTPEHNFVWPAAEPAGGPVPTTRWEAVREGVKDYRLVTLLEARARDASGPAADEARTLLEEIRRGVELKTEDYDPVSGGRIPSPRAGTLDAWRTRIADLIPRLP